MKVLHISAECYPAAKTGGLGDVVGALPKYLITSGVPSAVIIPKYGTSWLNKQVYRQVFYGEMRLHIWNIPFEVLQVENEELGYPLYTVNIPGKFDRPGIYSDPSGYFYGDEFERWICFQQAVLKWVQSMVDKPAILHCHDHHTGLIPFMIRYCPEYQGLSHIGTSFTIHNGRYQGRYSWDKLYLLPYFHAEARGVLDWGQTINCMASAIKCSWQFNTVSHTYLRELMSDSDGLEGLVRSEANKATGIINGIDATYWDPRTDKHIKHHLKKDISTYKKKNKQDITEELDLRPEWPLATFIGRMVYEKGVDILPESIVSFLSQGHQMNFVILGTGEDHYENKFKEIAYHFGFAVRALIMYNEYASHQLYAGSDFLLMPSRIEPCGLNQLYSMRYGTIPITRRTGGLQDTVWDYGEYEGTGVCFNHMEVGDLTHALIRATLLHADDQKLKQVRTVCMQKDYSWENSAYDYINWYKNIGL